MIKILGCNFPKPAMFFPHVYGFYVATHRWIRAFPGQSVGIMDVSDTTDGELLMARQKDQNMGPRDPGSPKLRMASRELTYPVSPW